jgi:hypothetical protein
MGSIVVDQSQLPLLIVTFVGQVDDDAFRCYLQETKDVLDRKQRYVVIMDASRSGVPPPSQRQMQAVWMEAHAQALARHAVGTVFVISSPLVRGALTAILWLQPLPHPHTVVADVAMAKVWAQTRLQVS